MYEIISGNIAEGVEYQVIGTGAIIYNSITVNAGNFFTGVDGVTTYTVDSGSPVVTEASTYIGQSFAFENDFYLGLFNDESRFLGISIGFEDGEEDGATKFRVIKKNNRLINSNNKMSINTYWER